MQPRYGLNKNFQKPFGSCRLRPAFCRADVCRCHRLRAGIAGRKSFPGLKCLCFHADDLTGNGK